MQELLMKRKAITMSVIFIVLALALSPSSLPRRQSGKNLLEPLNPEFITFTEARRLKSQLNPVTWESPGAKPGSRLGQLSYTPPTVSFSHVRGALDPVAQSAVYPARFDLRYEQRVSDVKDQGSYYTCWVFAAFASLESCRLPQDKLDFSEWHMAWNHGFAYNITEGGNSMMTASYLARWSGPVSEKDAPYGSAGQVGTNYIPARHVQQVIFLPERTNPQDNATIKYFLMNHGPVDFAFYWENAGFRSDNNSMYFPGVDSQNHRLTIVGWDDHYPAANFAYRPAGDGAFIARNSWGTAWGERGYCYISYYSMSVQQMMCFNNAEDNANFGVNYQYDPYGFVSRWGEEVSWGANVFTAESRQPIQAVSFYAVHPFLNYEIRVFKNISGESPVQETPAAFKTGSFTYPGYYTVLLDEEVPVQPGEKFSVAVKFSYNGFRHAVPIESYVAGYSVNARSQPGESFVRPDGGEWRDLNGLIPGANVCIKAFAKYKQSYLTLEGQRKIMRGWLVSRHFAYISIGIDNNEGVDISKIELLRSTQGNEFKSIREINPSELQNNRITVEDKHLDPYSRYIYQAIIYDANGKINNKSALISL